MNSEERQPSEEGDYFDIDTYNPQHQMGFVKHAFVLSMYVLMRLNDKNISEVYNWALYQTTKLAGDTDTNCAIVGGVVGAFAGVENIDEDKLNKVLDCNVKLGKNRKAKSRAHFI